MFLEASNDDVIQQLYSSHFDNTRMKAAFITTLSEIHHRNLAEALGAHSTITLLIDEFELPRSTAYEYLQIGTRLRSLPALTSAFTDGKISYTVVRYLMSYITPENDEELTNLALQYPLAKLRTVMAGSEPAEKTSAPEDYLTLTVDKHGNYRLNALLNPTIGTSFGTALKIGELALHDDLARYSPEDLNDSDIIHKALKRAYRTPSYLPPRDPSTGKFLPPSRFDIPSAINLLPAFLGLINVARTSPGSRATAPGANVQVMVTDDGRAFMPHNPAAPGSVLIDDVLNGNLQAHLLDSRGLTIHVSKSQRLVTPAQQQALLARWMHQCANPTCNHTRFLQFHHIIDYSKGGPTELWNLIPLCSACHAQITIGINKLEFGPGGTNTLIFSQASGRTYASENRSIPMRMTEAGFEFATDIEASCFGDELDEMLEAAV